MKCGITSVRLQTFYYFLSEKKKPKRTQIGEIPFESCVQFIELLIDVSDRNDLFHGSEDGQL